MSSESCEFSVRQPLKREAWRQPGRSWRPASRLLPARRILTAVNATTFDTYRIVKRLKDAGFSDHQAETITDVLRESRAADLSDLVTKSDLKAALSDLGTELKADIAGVKTEMADLKADIFKWIVPLLLGHAALTAALVRLQ